MSEPRRDNVHYIFSGATFGLVIVTFLLVLSLFAKTC